MGGSERVVVVGGGVGGLTLALALGRAGHAVTLLDRDPVPHTAGVEEEFAADRGGAPHVHQTHGFLALLQVLLRQRFPDVLGDLLAAGGTTMPMTADLGDPQPGDEDLRVIAVRRTTLDWVLRRAALAQPGVAVRGGEVVDGLVGDRAGVRGVRLADGTVVEGDAVVASTGRRGDVRGWLRPLGIEVAEEVRESGLMYLTRWYRLPPGFDVLSLEPKLGGDLGFVKYLGVPGDGGTLSITLAIRPGDAELRGALLDPSGFERACRLLPGPSQFFAGPELVPVGGVRPMGGLLNRIRRFTDDGGAPLAPGFSAIGDAHTCTNPLYGRGCSLAMVMAVLLADAIEAHPGDPIARGRAYEAACADQVEPWYHASVEMDAAGADPSGGVADPASPVARLFVAAMTDPILGRGFARLWGLLATPAELAADPQYVVRAAEVMANPDDYPIPPREGPSRAELLRQLDKDAVDA